MRRASEKRRLAPVSSGLSPRGVEGPAAGPDRLCLLLVPCSTRPCRISRSAPVGGKRSAVYGQQKCRNLKIHR